jgi:hypothetical protein
MERKDAELKSDRELLVDLRVGQAVLEERTEGLPTLTRKVDENAKDISWIKKVGLAMISIVGIVIALLRWVGGM